MKNKKFKENDLSKVAGGSSELVFNVKPGVKIKSDLELIDNRHVKNVHEEDINKNVYKEDTYADIL